MPPPDELAKLIARRDALDSNLAWLAWGMIFFTALVVYGLWIEYRDPIKAEWKARRWGVLRFWQLPHMVVGGLLITGGVAGELLIDSIASGKETDLRIVSGSIETHFRAEAARAVKEASEANLLAKKYESEIAEAQRGAAEAMKAAEHERLARVKLQEDMLWRGPREVLIWGARGKFAKRLKPFGPQVAALSICGPQAFVDGLPGEINFAANALAHVLIEAGWKADPAPKIEVNCASETIFVGVPPDAPQGTRDAAVALQAVLNEVLLQNNQGPSPAPPQGTWKGSLHPQM